MDLNKFFQSKTFGGAVLGILALIILLLVFKAGTMVGVRKADFFCKWSDNYHQNFGGPRGGFLGGFNDKDFIESNGTFGQIIKVDGSDLVIKGRNDIEKVVLVNDGTVIKRGQETIKSSDIKVDEYIVAIGQPNDAGQIEAKLIRIMPAPPSGSFNQPIGPMPPR